MQLAYAIAPGRGQTNILLSSVAATLAARGLALAGTLQTDTGCETDPRCDMDIRVLPNGPVIRISQSLGAQSHGCRLDPDALEQAVALTEARIAEGGVDLLIVNKFGKHEAEGRGFRNAIAEALARDIPVLVGVNKLNQDAFFAFCHGEAHDADHTPEALLRWAAQVCPPNPI
ncbi:DUF2478 domain-containing protein [Thalassovita taeanensis]|uniref:Nucleoside-triphosphatase THEP1 n=1 Tax=Thalassovita taeanensis TaxID=657014 RepID=A0A1H9B665_9RHOB|nr:DUF2478 domain-containing protein [Thalassovita taeanensis]SEP84434.1 Nucleoside-triphosphatase THEP1 [Thalassovita taeanensis]